MPMFAQQPCGCPVETSRFPYRCRAHAAPRQALPSRWAMSPWDREHTCPFCSRATPAGLACAIVETCPLCGVASCADHRTATYQLGVICPRVYGNSRTKIVRALYASLNALSGHAPRKKGSR